MRKKNSLPEFGELVVCTITEVNPYSALVKLEEYNTAGMIHISEVSAKWIRDIREFVKEGQKCVCRVMRIEPEKNHANLSLKRVRKEEASRKMKEFKSEERAEKLLEQVGEALGRSLEQIYGELGERLQDKCGSLFNAFQILQKDKNLLARKGIEDKYLDAMNEVAEKNFEESQTKIKCEVTISSTSPDAIQEIRKIFSNAEKEGAEIRYISAPIYAMTLTGSKPKSVEKKITKIAESVVEQMKSAGGTGSYKMIY